MPAPLEIERVYRLSGLPAIPAGAEVWQIEQGYLPRDAAEAQQPSDDRPGQIVEGRIRRLVRPDGSTEYFHTIKSGLGLVREETERPIAREEFDRLWPATEGARLRKSRFRICEGDLTWEIDQFHDLDLVLAEVELPSAETKVTLPSWLRPFVVREVTDEPEYRNSAIARNVGLWKAAGARGSETGG